MSHMNVRAEALKDIHEYLIEKGYRITPEGRYFDTWDVNVTWLSDNTTRKMTVELDIFGINRKK